MSKKSLKIGIVGSGISGLGCAHALLRNRDDEHGKHALNENIASNTELNIEVFESHSRLGGHTHTHELNVDGEKINVDSGFIVLNDRNYPTFTDFLSDLDVPTVDTRMSFAVSMSKGQRQRPYLEYAGSNMQTLCGGGKLAFSIRHIKMLFGIARFNRFAKKDLLKSMSTEQSLEDYLKHHNISDDVQQRYLLPMAAAIWSCPTEAIKAFPAITFLTFFNHHGLLDIRNRPQWKTVKGGSQRYIDALLKQSSFTVHSNHKLVAAQTLCEDNNRVKLQFANGVEKIFDAVVFAGHADQMFTTFDDDLKKQFPALDDVGYGDNKVYLHSDESFLPKNKSLWSCWNYLSQEGEQSSEAPLMVSYWMNELQNFKCKKTIVVTLNPTYKPDAEKTYAVMDYMHPIFNKSSVDAQSTVRGYQGKSNCYFAGAYLGYGFHEDGLKSGYRAAESLIQNIKDDLLLKTNQ